MKKLVKIFIWLMVSIVTFTAVYCSTLSVAKFSGAKIIIADAPKYVRRKIAGLGGTEGDLAGVGNPGSINLMLLSDPKVHAYVRDWFKIAKDSEDGKLIKTDQHVSAQGLYGMSLSEEGCYPGSTMIPNSYLRIRIPSVKNGANHEYGESYRGTKLTLAGCDAGILRSDSSIKTSIPVSQSGRHFGPFQQTPGVYQEGGGKLPPAMGYNWTGPTPRKSSLYYLPDEFAYQDWDLSGVLSQYSFFKGLQLPEAIKNCIADIIHGGGNPVSEFIGYKSASTASKIFSNMSDKKKAMDEVGADLSFDGCEKAVGMCQKAGVPVGSMGTANNLFCIVWLQKQGWHMGDYGRSDGGYTSFVGNSDKNFTTIYKAIYGKTPSTNLRGFMEGMRDGNSASRMVSTFGYGSTTSGTPFTKFYKLYNDKHMAWLPWITARNVFFMNAMSKYNYGIMLKGLGLAVDPTNPSTYLVGGNGNYTPPKTQGNVGNGLAKERDIICTEAKRICDAHIMYKYGGTDDRGYDCSGLVMHCYAKAGIKVPRTSQDQFKACKDSGMVFRDDKLVKPGDMVFFGDDNNPGHVALVKGVHANGEVYTYEAVATGKPCQSKPVRKRYGKQFTLYGRPKELVDLDNLTGSGGQFKPAGLTTVSPSGQASETVDYVNSKYKLCKASEMTWYYGDGKNLTSVYCGNNSSAWNQIGAYGYKDGFPLFAQGQYDRSGLKPRGSRNLPGTGCGIFSLASSLHAIGFGRADNPGIPAKIRECILKYGKNGYLHPYALDMYITSHGAWYVPGAGMTGAFDSIMRNLGLSVKPIANTDKRTTTNNVIEELKKGHPVIASFGPSTFSMYKLDSLNNKQVSYLGRQAVTRGGHYITLYSYGEYKTKDGKTIKGCALVDSSNYRRNPSTNEVIVDIESIYEPKSKGISWFALQYPIKGLSGETQGTGDDSGDDDGGYIDQDFFLDDSTIHTGTMSDAMALIRPTSSEDTGFIDITGKRLDQLGMFIGTDCKFLNGNTCLVFSKTGGVHYELYADGGKFKNIRIGQWNRLSDILDSRDVVIMVKAYTYIDGKKVYTGMYGEVD